MHLSGDGLSGAMLHVRVSPTDGRNQIITPPPPVVYDSVSCSFAQFRAKHINA